MERKKAGRSPLRFPIVAVLLAGILYGIGYYPAASYDAPHGTFSLALGLALVLFLIVPSFLVTWWALERSLKTFLLAFGLGFLARLILLVIIFILYTKFVRPRDFSFTLAFGVGYLVISVLEIIWFKDALIKDQESRGASKAE